jgi:choline monooxygenase
MPSPTATDAAPARVRPPVLAPLPPALAAGYYTDPLLAEAEQRLLFERSWQLVGHESDLPEPGSRFAAAVAGREVLVVRKEDGSLAAHLNVCRHRGARLLEDGDPVKPSPAIRCPYHGWTYHLDGALVGAPEGRQIPCFDKAKLGLHPVRVESFLGFLFVNLDPNATPLAESCAPLVETIGRYVGADLLPVGKARVHQKAGNERQPANWKVVVDNYLEGYHVPVAHPGLMRLFDYQNYITAETSEAYAVFEVPIREKPSSNWVERLYQRLATPMRGLRETDRRVWRYVAIYPNTLLDFYPDHVLAWTVLPDGVDGATLPGAYYTKPGAGLRTSLARRLNIHIGWITNDEDEALVARVQQGLATPGYQPGPLSHRETGVAWFHERVRGDLASHTGDPAAASGSAAS